MAMRMLSLTILYLALAGAPASAQVLYDNGPINGTTLGWTINNGVSDTFALSANSTVGGFELGVWEYPGDVLSSVDWVITSQENGGTFYAHGTVSGKNLVDQFLSVNQYGYDVDKITATGLNVGLSAQTYWLNLKNAVAPHGDPIFWDENNGVGCGGSNGKGSNCPSMASEPALGTIPSEAFTITGTSGGSTPEPGSMMLLASGVIGLASVLRRKLF